MNNPFTIKHRLLQAIYLILLMTYLPFLAYSGYRLVDAVWDFCSPNVVIEEVYHDQIIPRVLPPPPPQPICRIKYKPKADDVLHFAQQMPMFPGCEQEDFSTKKKCAEKKMLEFLYSNLKYPPIARASAIEGMVVVKFTVEEDGILSDIHPLKELNGLTEEALRVVKLMPKWEPGLQNGVPVKVYFNLPVRFKLEL